MDQQHQNSTSAPTNRCWASSIGSVDVEDLALLFADNRDNNVSFAAKSYTNPNHRVFRNRSNNVTLKNPQSYVPEFPTSVPAQERYYGCEYGDRCYLECVKNPISVQHRQPYNFEWPLTTDNKPLERLNDPNRHAIPIGLPCTEDQWLACPATNCSVFDNIGASTDNSTTWNNSTNQNIRWNHYENRTNFGHVLPPCMLNDSAFDLQMQNNLYYECYPQLEDEQQFFEDYLSNEKRKEKSRDAARCRRSRETDIFTELAGALPLEPDQAAHLDKASIMRLAIAYLKVRSVIDSLDEPLTKTKRSADMDALFPNALDGFMLVLSTNGDMVYLSENVGEYLGVSQMDLMGQSVFEYSHPCDHDDLRKYLSITPSDVKENRPCNFLLRLKCTLTSKGRKVNLKSASYKVIHCTGRAMGSFETNTEQQQRSIESANRRDSDSSDSQSGDERDSDIGFSSGFGYTGAFLAVVGCPIPHPSNIEVPLGRQTFLSKHSINMKFTYADDRLAEYLGWTSSELLGKSVFEFHHAFDNAALAESFKSLFSKGQCETTAYRFLGKKGGFAWIVTQATLIYCSKQHKPISVVCVNHILSGIECEDEVYSERQLKARKAAKANGDYNSSVVSAAEEFEVKDTVILPSLVFETPSNTDESLDGENEFAEEAEKGYDVNKNVNSREYASDSSILETTSYKTGPSRPSAVTESIFKSQAGLENQNFEKEQLAPSEVLKTLDNQRERPTWFFQDKPLLEYDPSLDQRCQTVTKNLFVPLSSIEDTDTKSQQQYEQAVGSRPTPQTTTASIFAPRTKEMNKGFLTFSEDQPGLTMLKDEPEDLTHLAPTPGDVCVPLEDTPFLSDDMLDEFILGDENYCTLLSPEGLRSELPNSDLNDSLTKDDNDIGETLESTLADGDPFIYRDIHSPCSLSPDLLSPNDATSVTGVSMEKSPDQSRIDPLHSPQHRDIVDGMITIGSDCNVGNPIAEDEMLMLSINDVIGDDELALRAPFIPMSDQDEALQLLISDDTVMWGPTQPPDEKVKWHNVNDDKPVSKQFDGSSLARLLKIDATKHKAHGLVDPLEIFGQISKGNNGSRIERPLKRVYPVISTGLPNESKRRRFQESKVTIGATPGVFLSTSYPADEQSVAKNLNSSNYDEHCIDLCEVLEAEEKLEPMGMKLERGGSQLLLQQLMSRDNVQSSSSVTKFRGDTTTSRSARTNGLLATIDTDVGVDRKLNTGYCGDGGGKEASNGSSTPRGDQRQSNSVLMNLLVSGCDKATGLTMLQQGAQTWSSMAFDDHSTDSQLVPTNGNTMLSLFDELSAANSITANAQFREFSNHFNDDTADLLPRPNLLKATMI